MNSQWSQFQSKAGMTLLELLVVIVIMVVIASLSIPAFTSMGRGAGMRGAVAEVTSTLSLSRQWAITKREEVTFAYTNPATGSCYSVYVIEPDGTNTFIQTTNYLDDGIFFKDNGSLTFKTTGGLTQGTTPIPIPITNLQGTIKTVKVNGLTGGITVE